MRVIYTILILGSIIGLPYWVYLPAIFLGIVLFPLYIEAIFLGLLIDTIYGRGDAIILGYPFGIIAAILVLFALPLREHLRYNA